MAPFNVQLRAGESVIEYHQITAENQDPFRSTCAKLTSMIGGADEYGAVMPPIGWWIVEITTSDGGYETIWFSPDLTTGVRSGECMGQTVFAEGANAPVFDPSTLDVKPGRIGWLGLAFLAGGVYLAYKFFKGK